MNYDILSIHENHLTLKAEAGKICARKKSQIQRHGVRRFQDGKLFQTSRLGAATTDRLLADTQEWGGPGTQHDFGFASAHKESRTGHSIKKSMLEDFEIGLKKLNQEHPDFVFSGRCTTQNLTMSLQSSYGLDLQTSGEICEWYYMYQRKGSGNMLDGFFGEASANTDIHRLIDEHSPILKAQHKEVSLQSGRLPVLFVEEMSPLTKLVESFLINKYEEGAALYSGQLGQQLFSKKISLVDSTYDPLHGQFQFFDGEGVVRTEDLKLVDQGRFVSLISDLRFGNKFGKPSSGNGLRNYNQGVQLRPRALRLEKGQRPWRSILKDLDRCLIAIITAGGDSNDLGEFSSPVQVGYIAEKGEIVGRAPQLTVSTSVSDYLGKNLIDVSSDGFTPSSPSACLIAEMDILVS